MKSMGNSVTDAGINANTNVNGTTLKTNGAKYASLLVKDVSGTHATHIVTIRVSENNTDWYDTTHTITGTGVLEGVIVIGKYVKARVTTVEGGVSVIDISLILR